LGKIVVNFIWLTSLAAIRRSELQKRATALDREDASLGRPQNGGDGNAVNGRGAVY
jgi:hypothetical protein